MREDGVPGYREGLNEVEPISDRLRAALPGARGLKDKIEQYKELTVPDPSTLADQQRARFERLWDHGVALETLRRSGDWEEYRQRARHRRLLEREDRRRLLRLDARSGRFLGRSLTRPETREKARLPRHYQLGLVGAATAQPEPADRALFWRCNANTFRAPQ